MSALPSPSGSGPQRPEPAHGSSRHAHRAAEPEAAEDGDPGDGSWFAVVLRGYDRTQVDTRLAGLDHRIHEEIRRAETAEQALSDARAQLRRLQEQAAAAPAEQRGEDAGFGRRVERVLQTAEQEATELRERASAEADEIVARAHREAEDRRTRTEEALLGRASDLDRKFAARSTALDERDQECDRREQELGRREQESGRREDDVAERERAAEERIGSVREEADRILASARADADDVRTAARDEAAAALRDAEHDAEQRRAGVTRDVDRLATLRDEVRGELSRMRETLTAELGQEPVAATPDDALFGASEGTSAGSGSSTRPSTTGASTTGASATGVSAGTALSGTALSGTALSGTALSGSAAFTGASDDSSMASISSLGSSRGSSGASFVWSSGTGADRVGPAADVAGLASDPGSGLASGDAPGSGSDSGSGSDPGSESDPDSEADGGPSDASELDDDANTATGTLLLGPGRWPGAGRDDDPDSTTIGQIPPISLTSIGVLPFGDLGTARDNARTRSDGAAGTSRGHRGPTRGPGPGRRSR